MFVSALFDGWRRILEEGLSNHHHHQNGSGNEMQEFLEEQRQIWTPPELYEKCCVKWLAHGKIGIRPQDHTNHNHNHNHHPHYSHHGLTATIEESEETSYEKTRFSCLGKCQRFHPTITLFFDSEKQLTVAVLSHRLDPFIRYLEERVVMGTARTKSAFYYELNGYVRENRKKMKQQTYFGYHLVQVAIGALQESDLAQKKHLEEDSLSRKKKRTSFVDPHQVEKVLEVCRLHRLGEDLDVFSIHCLGRVSKGMRRMACRMAVKRMQEVNLIVSPLVDGCVVAGYSVFRRTTSSPLDTVLQREQGKLIEYSKSRPIPCKCYNKVQVPTTRMEPSSPSMAQFTWACEELSFANLDHEWGDILVQEYLGQKLNILWKCGKADVIDGRTEIPLASLRLGTSKSHGIWKLPFFSLEVDIEKNAVEQVDSVTTTFQGCARVVSMEIDFLRYIRAYACVLEKSLLKWYMLIEEERPLLQREIDFLGEVKSAASIPAIVD